MVQVDNAQSWSNGANKQNINELDLQSITWIGRKKSENWHRNLEIITWETSSSGIKTMSNSFWCAWFQWVYCIWFEILIALSKCEYANWLSVYLTIAIVCFDFFSLFSAAVVDKCLFIKIWVRLKSHADEICL